MELRRGDIHLVSLDPSRGKEMRKKRPCVVVSPDEMNRHLGTVIVAPMTTRIRRYPTRVPVRFRRRDGEIALDQLRAVDPARLSPRLGQLDAPTRSRALAVLREMFAA